MSNDISLGLTEAARDKALILILLSCRINARMIRDLYHNLSKNSPEEMAELRNQYAREELVWVFRTLGEDSELTASGLQELLDQ